MSAEFIVLEPTSADECILRAAVGSTFTVAAVLSCVLEFNVRAGAVSCSRDAVVAGELDSMVLTIADFDAVENESRGFDWALEAVAPSVVFVSGCDEKRADCFVVDDNAVVDFKGIFEDVLLIVVVGRSEESRDDVSIVVFLSSVACW